MQHDASCFYIWTRKIRQDDADRKAYTGTKSRGYRVATVKHTHQNLELDTPGKDSWRYAQAGSNAVFLSKPKNLVLIKSVEITFRKKVGENLISNPLYFLQYNDRSIST